MDFKVVGTKGIIGPGRFKSTWINLGASYEALKLLEMEE